MQRNYTGPVTGRRACTKQNTNKVTTWRMAEWAGVLTGWYSGESGEQVCVWVVKRQEKIREHMVDRWVIAGLRQES